MSKTTAQPKLDQSAAVRHAVYCDLLGYLRHASFEQARRFAANLYLCNATDEIARERQFNAVMFRFINLHVTPDIAEIGPISVKPPSVREIEQWLNRKYGERLKEVPGFYRRTAEVDSGQLITESSKTINSQLYTLNLPRQCAAYGYRSDTGFYRGILFQPLTRAGSFFLLSSAKYGGPKAIRLTPRDEQYFTQHEEVN